MASEQDRSLVVLHAADQRLRDRVIPIGEELRIGRVAQDGVDLVIDDKLLSGRHATIARAPEAKGYELVDHHSRNGSFVDGERVERRKLADGSILRLGVHLFELSRTTRELAFIDGSVDGDATGALVGHSAELRATLAALDRVAADPGPAVLVGEHGCGKEAAARRIHHRSARVGPFISADMSSLSSEAAASLLFGDAGGARLIATSLNSTLVDDEGFGMLSRAEGGTLLLEAIDALDLGLQKRLLEAIATGNTSEGIDVRLIATSELDLDALVEDGSFSRELYRLLAPRLVEIPALRSRRCDVPVIARHLWTSFAPGRTLEFSATCLEKLLLYDWPMNVRELGGMMQRLSAMEGELTTIRSAHLPKEIQARVRQPTLDQLRFSGVTVHLIPSRDELSLLLARFDGDVVGVAQFYAKDKRQVYRWLKRHDLKIADFRRGRGE
jgi:DNA-binding NtrC family response regulator